VEKLFGKIWCRHAKVFGSRFSVSGMKGKGKMPFVQKGDVGLSAIGISKYDFTSPIF